jgi:hypothetical protein
MHWNRWPIGSAFSDSLRASRPSGLVSRNAGSTTFCNGFYVSWITDVPPSSPYNPNKLRKVVRNQSGHGEEMASRISAMPDTHEWKRAYMAAIVERNREELIRLILEARAKLAGRRRELMADGFIPCDELDAIHDADYLLGALQSSLPYRDDLLN